MQYTISTQPDGNTFTSSDDENILDAGLAAGLSLPYGCRHGACGACKARIVTGQVEQANEASSALTQEERDAGYVLLCQAHARSDVIMEVKTLKRTDEIEIRQLPGRVEQLERVADDVMIARIKLPASEDFRFQAGQYVNFLLPNGQGRSFSIANAPESGGYLEFHIRRVPGGYLTGQIFEQWQPKEMIRFEGPLGSFHLNEASDRPIILLAGGTGFAPIKSLVEHMINAGIRRPMHLYWGAQKRAGLYMETLAFEWTRTLQKFTYVPVLSTEEEGWSGRTGLVHHAVMEDFSDLSAYEVYACGSPAMVDAARRDFLSHRGLAQEYFFADAFTLNSSLAE